MPNYDFDNTQMVAGMKKGADAAWSEMLRRYGRLIYSIPRKNKVPESDIEDVAQEALIRMHRGINGLKKPQSIKAWAARITYLTATDYFGAFKILADDLYNFADWADTISNNPLEIVMREDQKVYKSKCLRKAITTTRLNKKERIITDGLLVDGEPDYKEIAAKAGVAVGSVGPMRARIFKKLRTSIEEMGYEA